MLALIYSIFFFDVYPNKRCNSICGIGADSGSIRWVPRVERGAAPQEIYRRNSIIVSVEIRYPQIKSIKVNPSPPGCSGIGMIPEYCYPGRFFYPKALFIIADAWMERWPSKGAEHCRRIGENICLPRFLDLCNGQLARETIKYMKPVVEMY